MSWEPDEEGSDSEEPWAEDPWESDDEEEEQMSEVQLLDLELTAARTAQLLSKDLFLIVRLEYQEVDNLEIASRTGISVLEIEEVQRSIGVLIREHLGRLVSDPEKGLTALALYGHRNDCAKCGEEWQNDIRFCCKCGTLNPHYDSRYFEVLWGNSDALEQAGECHLDHPTAIDHECEGYCNLCGILLPTDHPNAP